MEENGFHQPENKFPPARISSVFKTGFRSQQWRFPLVVKELSSKVTVSIRGKSFSNNWNEGFVQKYVSTRQKKGFLRQKSLKKYIKSDLHQPKNAFPLPRMRHLLENTFPGYKKTGSPGKKIEESGFQQHENVFLLKLVPPNFSNGFQHQKKSYELSLQSTEKIVLR